MKILPNKRLSFIIAGCITTLLFSSSLFSGLLSTTSTRIGTQVAFASNYLIQQAVAQDAEVDEQTTQDDGGGETTPPDGGGEITPPCERTTAGCPPPPDGGGETTPPPDAGEGVTTLPPDVQGEVTIPPSGGTPPPGVVPYSCDSTTKECACMDSFDCFKMGRDGVCDPNQTGFRTEGSLVYCRWKSPK